MTLKNNSGNKNLTCVLHRYFVSILPALAARSSRQSTLCCLPDSTILFLRPVARNKELASKYTARHKLTIQPTSCHLSPLSSSSLALHHRVTDLQQNTLQFKIWITFKSSQRTSFCNSSILSHINYEHYLVPWTLVLIAPPLAAAAAPLVPSAPAAPTPAAAVQPHHLSTTYKTFLSSMCLRDLFCRLQQALLFVKTHHLSPLWL